MNIRDVLTFEHRNVMLDIFRNWISSQNVMRIIDVMNFNKFNRLRLHATNFQFWFLKISSLFILIKKRTYRKNQIWSVNNFEKMQKYGLYRNVEIYLKIDTSGYIAFIVHFHFNFIIVYNHRSWIRAKIFFEAVEIQFFRNKFVHHEIFSRFVTSCIFIQHTFLRWWWQAERRNLQNKFNDKFIEQTKNSFIFTKIREWNVIHCSFAFFNISRLKRHARWMKSQILFEYNISKLTLRRSTKNRRQKLFRLFRRIRQMIFRFRFRNFYRSRSQRHKFFIHQIFIRRLMFFLQKLTTSFNIQSFQKYFWKQTTLCSRRRNSFLNWIARFSYSELHALISNDDGDKDNVKKLWKNKNEKKKRRRADWRSWKNDWWKKELKPEWFRWSERWRIKGNVFCDECNIALETEWNGIKRSERVLIATAIHWNVEKKKKTS